MDVLDQQEQEVKKEVTYFHKPGLVLRVKSMLIDNVFVIVLMLLCGYILNLVNVESGTVRGVVLGLVLLYEPILISLQGTIGQRMMGLRVLEFSAYKEDRSLRSLNFFSSIARFVFKILLGWISLLTIHADNYGQAIHDKIGQSVMTFR